MDEGYIKIHRRFSQWEWYQDTNTKAVFLHILLNANYEDKKWRGIVIHRGEWVSSYPKIAEEIGISVMQVRTAIKHLILTREITCKSMSKFTVFTVVSYDKYQASNTIDNRQITSKQQASNRQVTTTKERKEREESKEYKRYCPDDAGSLVAEIIEYLNSKAGTHYKCSADSVKHINARLNEKYSLDDFKKVVDVKVAEWQGTKMEQYLRPSTLFGTKFENYLNQKPAANTNKFTEFNQRDYDFAELEKQLLQKRR